MHVKCFFTDCAHEVMPGSWKCHVHRKRSRCVVVNCTNQVYARQLCVRHGGRSKCLFENCTLNRRSGHYCARHTHLDLRKACTEPGCEKQAHAHGKCVRHGGGRACKVLGCTKHGRQRGLCYKHFHRLVAPASMSCDPTDSIHAVTAKMSIANLLNDEMSDVSWRDTSLPPS